MNKALLLSPLITLAGCTHSIHMVHTDGFGIGETKLQNAQYIEVETAQDVVFFFAKDTNYVDEAKAKLEQACPGELSAVSTQYSTSHGFFSWTNKIKMKAICNQSTAQG